jgi:hypothetical protein
MKHSTLKISGLLAAVLLGGAITLPAMAEDTVVIETTTGPSQYYVDKHPELWPSREISDGPTLRHYRRDCPHVRCFHE